MKSLKFLFGLMGLIALALLANAETAITTGLAIGPVAYMEKYAQNNFSSFEGDNMYTGMGDHFLDFGGPSESFATEKHAGRVFTMTITNQFNTTKNVTLIPGYQQAYPGQTSATKLFAVEGDILNDAGTKVIGAGSPNTIDNFMAWIAKNPTSVAGIRVSHNNSATQIEQNITVNKLSPFKTLESKVYALSTYVSEQDNRDKMVTIPTPGLIVGPETELILPCVASGITTITFFCGAVLSLSSALQAKRDEAVKTINTIGLQNVQLQQATLPRINPMVIPRQTPGLAQPFLK